LNLAPDTTGRLPKEAVDTMHSVANLIHGGNGNQTRPQDVS
jgi:hypothetical protein